MLDIFDTQEMIEAIEINQEPTTFLMDKGFPNEKTFGTAEVDFDLRKKGRRSAAYVNREGEGQNVDKTKFKQLKYKPPYLKPKKTITVGDFLKRNFGDIQWQTGESQLTKAGQKMQEEFDDLDEMIVRAEEVQASQALLTGKITPIDENGILVGDEIDYDRDAALTVVAAPLWDGVSPTILEDIRAWRQLVDLTGGLLPTACVLGTAASNAFQADDEVRAYLNNRRIDSGSEIVNRAESMNASVIGNIDGLMFYEYWGTYLNSAGVPTKYIPANKLVMFNPETNWRMYGVNEWIEEGVDRLFAFKRLPVSWTTKDPSKRWLQVHSAPLMVTKNPDTSLVATVTA